jgi:uncharacterized protein YlxW (UPF0749 family)
MSSGDDTSRRRAPAALILLVPAITFGLLVTMQVGTQERRSPITSRYQLTLAEAVADLQREQGDLRREVASLRTQLVGILSEGARHDSAAARLQPELDELRRAAGLTTESGAGVIVTLDDGRLPTGNRAIERAIVHAQDLTDVFNAAWSAGARAISVNGERIVATSSCVGATIQVNGVLMSPPFEISVIGDPERLSAEMSTGRGTADLRQRRDLFGLGFQVALSRALDVPAFTGTIRVNYARVGS